MRLIGLRRCSLGPHHVVCKTPLENVRITTFFAGDHEVDPRRAEVVETHGCRVASVSVSLRRSLTASS
jgi:hypothetical protein